MSWARANRRTRWKAKWLLTGVLMLLLLVVAGCGGLGGDDGRILLTITQEGRSVARFSVEVAHTQAQRSVGLSNRDSLAEGTGMLFVFPYPGNYWMWMADVKFPLDLLFIDANGYILRVYKNVPPCPNRFDCLSMNGGALVSYVLEIPAGSVDEYGIRVGDRVTWNVTLPPAE